MHHPASPRTTASVGLALVLLLGACAGSDEATDAADGSATVPPSTVASETSTTAAAPSTTTTETSTTTAPSTTEACDTCLSEEAEAAIGAFVAAWDEGDWETFSAIQGGGELEWEADIGTATEAHIDADFRWGVALNQDVSIERCVDANGAIACDLVFEDDIHRATAAFGLEPSVCRFNFRVDDGVVEVVREEIGTCFTGYDQAMHTYGTWFEETHPDLEPIQGFHYRAWNQFGDGAPERAVEYLDDWIATFPDEG